MHRFTEPEGLLGAKSKRWSRRWRHPRNLLGDLTYQVAAAVALMEMGIREYRTIAQAVGLTMDEVRCVDMAEDPSVKQLAAAGIPAGEFFKLIHHVRCPRCCAKIALVPCVACHNSLQILADRVSLTETRSPSNRLDVS